ncbi:MAG: hypothetical protein M1827_005856 [Pycnora praestabilis]|nr:MAG: hypothetical protein M1827_005856 [Pycnora praestabilis]
MADPDGVDHEKMGVKIRPERAKELAENLSNVVKRMQAVHKEQGRNTPRLIAVSKLKPASDILSLHTPPPPSSPSTSPRSPVLRHLHFGENYYQELLQKSTLLPRTIRWHFIGALQTNKCKPLAEQIPNLWAVESMDSVKKADGLEKGRRRCVERLKAEREGKDGDRKEEKEEEEEEEEGVDMEEPLRVFVQVNTSGEENKSGVEPEETLTLCTHIREICPHLKLQGLMTIGAIARSQASTAETENEDFVTLRNVRREVAKELGIEEQELELSMGMSSDFEAAIKQGSDEVRVGSTIFGQRPAKGDARVKDEVDEGGD